MKWHPRQLHSQLLRLIMHPDFKDCISRVSFFVLNSLDEIQTAPQDIDPREMRANLLTLLTAFDQMPLPGSPEETSQLVKYALTAWADDLFSRARWPHAAAWNAHSLEKQLFGSTSRHWRFFELAEIARQTNDRDALRVFRFCVEFGFRGIYAHHRLKVKLSDPLPMARGRRQPTRIPAFAEVSAEQPLQTMLRPRGAETSPSNVLTKSPDRRPAVKVLPPTLAEWCDKTFDSEASARNAHRPHRWAHHIFLRTKAVNEWAIVMAIGGLLSAVLFAIGH